MSCDFSWELAQLKEAESIGDLAKIQAEDGLGKAYVLVYAGLCLGLGAKLAVNPSLEAQLGIHASHGFAPRPRHAHEPKVVIKSACRTRHYTCRWVVCSGDETMRGMDAELSPHGWVHGVFHPLSKPPAHQ